MILLRTLAARLFLLTALWAVIATALVAWFLGTGYRDSVERNLRDRLTANIYNIMGSVVPGQNGELTGAPDLRDSRFLRLGSGYYWSVSALSGNRQLKSQSLAGGTIDVPPGTDFDQSFQREFVMVDPSGRELIGIEARAFLGDGDDLFSFIITASREEADEQVSQFIRELLVVLGLFASGFILVTFFLVRFGLAPVNHAVSRLADIREGRANSITGTYPQEIQPLIDETNALIDSNRSVVERARTQVGNLAHSLKTPLAVLRNEAVNARPQVRQVMEQQVQLMQGQIQSYLDRAMISARAGTVTSRTDVRSSLERLVRVMQKLNPDLSVRLEMQLQKAAFSGEQQDFEEMVGNLLENAVKFARSTVIVTADRSENRLQVRVEDDGPGMDEEQISQAVKRGTRLDESKPGTGLGLSIVRDIAAEYKGEVSFGRAKAGGLSARLILPSVF